MCIFQDLYRRNQDLVVSKQRHEVVVQESQHKYNHNVERDPSFVHWRQEALHTDQFQSGYQYGMECGLI